MNALELADILDRSVLALSADAAAELRRLYEVNQELLEALKELCEAADTSDGCQYGTLSTRFVREIARAAIAKAEGRA